eukprot:6181279-Pleurochrysis_carterae.AAC.1
MALHEEQWDWHAAHVPAGMTEEQQAEKEERERAKAKEKKKRAEKAKKERKRAEEEVRTQAATKLHAAMGGENVEALTAAMQEAARVGCSNDEASETLCASSHHLWHASAVVQTLLWSCSIEHVEAARAKIDKLLKDAADPEVQRQRQRALRAAAAEARLNGCSAR